MFSYVFHCFQMFSIAFHCFPVARGPFPHNDDLLTALSFGFPMFSLVFFNFPKFSLVFLDFLSIPGLSYVFF